MFFSLKDTEIVCTYVCVLVSTWPHTRSCLGPLSSPKMLFSHIINCAIKQKPVNTKDLCLLDIQDKLL